MARQRITDTAIQKIKDSEELSRIVADKMKIRTHALPSYLGRKSPSLNAFSVVEAIMDFTGLSKDHVLEDIPAEVCL